MCAHAALAQGVADAMLHMIPNQRALGVVDDAFHGLKLLREVHAGSAIGKHREDGGKLTVCLLQLPNDGGVRSMLPRTPYPLGGRVSKGHA